MRLAPERAQLAIGERADGPVRARVCADVCVARRVALAYIEHGAVGVLSVYPVGAAENDGRATVRSAHGGGVIPFLSHVKYLQICKKSRKTA